MNTKTLEGAVEYLRNLPPNEFMTAYMSADGWAKALIGQVAKERTDIKTKREKKAKKCLYLSLRCSVEDAGKIKQAAIGAGLTVSQYIRRAALGKEA